MYRNIEAVPISGKGTDEVIGFGNYVFSEEGAGKVIDALKQWIAEREEARKPKLPTKPYAVVEFQYDGVTRQAVLLPEDKVQIKGWHDAKEFVWTLISNNNQNSNAFKPAWFVGIRAGFTILSEGVDL